MKIIKLTHRTLRRREHIGENGRASGSMKLPSKLLDGAAYNNEQAWAILVVYDLQSFENRAVFAKDFSNGIISKPH